MDNISESDHIDTQQKYLAPLVHRRRAVPDPTSPWYISDDLHSFKRITRLNRRYTVGTQVPHHDPFVNSVAKGFDNSLREELKAHYQRSPITPQGLCSALAKYGTTPAILPEGLAKTLAQIHTRKLFKFKEKVKPMMLTCENWQTFEHELVGSSNPGFPLCYKYKTQRDCYPEIQEGALALKSGKQPYPCMVSTRPGMLKLDLGETSKLRGVWMYPANMKVLEMQFVKPFMNRFKKTQLLTPYLTGQNQLKQIPAIVDYAMRNSNFVAVYDAIAADTSPGSEMIQFAFSILEDNLDLQTEQEFFDWKVQKKFFMNTPLLMPDGWLFRKHGKVPSGSNWTQIIQTILNTLVVVYAHFVVTHTLLEMPFGIGDDILFEVGTHLTPGYQEKFVAAVLTTGYECNMSKLQLSNNPKEIKFLGHYSLAGRSIRAWEESLKLLLFPERYVGGEDRSYERVQGILIDSALSDSRTLRFAEIFQQHTKPYERSDPTPEQLRYMKYALNLDEPFYKSSIDPEFIFCIT